MITVFTKRKLVSTVGYSGGVLQVQRKAHTSFGRRIGARLSPNSTAKGLFLLLTGG
jgi:hypothetical protein